MKSEKLKNVSYNNRTKQVMVTYKSGKKVLFHYGQIGFTKNISSAWIDPETGGRSIGFRFEDGSLDFMPYDQPLALVKDPEFLLQTQIGLLTNRCTKTHTAAITCLMVRSSTMLL